MRVHKIKIKPDSTKEELAASVSRHFANQTVKETDTITCFLYTAHYKGKPSQRKRMFVTDALIRLCVEIALTHLKKRLIKNPTSQIQN